MNTRSIRFRLVVWYAGLLLGVFILLGCMMYAGLKLYLEESLSQAQERPTLIGILTIMPRPVMASAMLFTAVFILIGGVQIISSRILDGRRTLVIGMGMMAFIMVSVFPGTFAGVLDCARAGRPHPKSRSGLTGLPR